MSDRIPDAERRAELARAMKLRRWTANGVIPSGPFTSARQIAFLERLEDLLGSVGGARPRYEVLEIASLAWPPPSPDHWLGMVRLPEARTPWSCIWTIPSKVPELTRGILPILLIPAR